MKKYKYDIFLSYSYHDKDEATILVQTLSKHGLKIWIDEYQLIPGEDWISAIDNAISNSNYIFVLIGSSPIKKGYVQQELEMALNFKKNELVNISKIIPVLLPNSDYSNIPEQLKSFQFMDLRDKKTSDKIFDEFIQRIKLEIKIEIANNKAEILISENKYHEAVTELNELLNILETPNFDVDKSIILKIYVNLGISFRRLSEFNKAVDYFSQGLNIDPQNHIIINNLASVFFHLRQYDKSIELFKKAISLNDSNPDYYNNLANIYKELGQLDKALKLFQKAYSLSPNNPIILNNLASVYQASGELTKAIDLLNKAIEIDPNYALLYNSLGGIYNDLGDFNNAYQLYQKALSLQLKLYGERNPAVANCFSNLGTVCSQLHKFPEAESYYKSALNIYEQAYGQNHPEYGITLNNLAELLIETGNIKIAVELFQKALEIVTNIFGEEHPNSKLISNNLRKALEMQTSFRKSNQS